MCAHDVTTCRSLSLSLRSVYISRVVSPSVSASPKISSYCGLYLFGSSEVALCPANLNPPLVVLGVRIPIHFNNYGLNRSILDSLQREDVIQCEKDAKPDYPLGKYSQHNPSFLFSPFKYPLSPGSAVPRECDNIITSPLVDWHSCSICFQNKYTFEMTSL